MASKTGLAATASTLAHQHKAVGDLEKVKALLEFAETQAGWKYDKDTISAVYIAQMMKGSTVQPPTKISNGFRASVHQCNKYVKIALWKAGYGPATEAIGNSISPARAMGPALIAAGFQDVTSILPDARWAAPGDVIVYERKGAPNDAGHIDIRSYDGYISDFIGLELPTSKFNVTGIYRKYYDPLPEKRMKAFLKVLREWECHEESDDAKRYFLMLNPLDGSRIFSDTSKHPFEGRNHKGNTPAGAYQTILGTYTAYTADRFGIGPGFTPIKQDRIAVTMLENEKNALANIRKGEIELAANKLPNQWSSLPSGKHPRKAKKDGKLYIYTMDDVNRIFEENLKSLL